MIKAMVPLADGFEELEAVTIIDILRRAGIDVTTTYLKQNPVAGAHNLKVTADRKIDEVDFSEYSLITLPGGLPGSSNLMEDKRVISFITGVYERGGFVSAICAAPMALGRAGVLKGKKATCYPGFEDKMTGAKYVNDPVVVDGKVITGNGPGSAVHFALTLVEALMGSSKAEELRKGMLVK
ncbi:MAG: DJ-1/PfpI family protein [Oligoflexales bacterium]|nr:DJ-1/PfpI family protein [Oligoflexales bacterium]